MNNEIIMQSLIIENQVSSIIGLSVKPPLLRTCWKGQCTFTPLKVSSSDIQIVVLQRAFLIKFELEHVSSICSIISNTKSFPILLTHRNLFPFIYLASDGAIVPNLVSFEYNKYFTFIFTLKSWLSFLGSPFFGLFHKMIF